MTVTKPRRIVLATNNPGKQRELAALLQAADIQLVTPQSLGLELQVDETGSTFEENALLKAGAFAAASGLPAIADDSGLCVDGLGGAPGLHSARYAPQEQPVQERSEQESHQIATLLKALDDAGVTSRSASFVCCLAYADPPGTEWVVTGTLHGEIAREPSGTEGFGYDPIFLVPHLNRTLAQLSDEEKNAVSHRSAAAREAQRRLKLGQSC